MDIGSYFRSIFSRLARIVVAYIGSKITDCQTGAFLGRAFLVSWRGKFYVLFYNGEKPLRLVWLSEDKVRYWRARVGFTTYSDTFDD